MSTRLHALPLRERPAARIYSYGTGSVNLTELLAAVTGGSRQLELAENLLVHYRTLSALSQAPTTELEQLAGIGHATAARLKAALELGRRLVVETPDDRPQIRSPEDAANLVMLEMSLLVQEHTRLMLLDIKNRVIEIPTVYIGNLNTSVVRIAELFRCALRANCASMIVVHNHPSGDPTPSPEDVRVTEQIVQAGTMLDIDVIDHLIIGKQRFVSLKELKLGFA